MTKDVVAKAQKDDVVVYTLLYSAHATAFTQKASERQPPPDQPGSYDPTTDIGDSRLAVAPAAKRLRYSGSVRKPGNFHVHARAGYWAAGQLKPKSGKP
jgi:hypothetical protein